MNFNKIDIERIDCLGLEISPLLKMKRKERFLRGNKTIL